MLSQNFLKSYLSKIHKVEKSQIIETFAELSKDYRNLYAALENLEISIFLLSQKAIPIFANEYARRRWFLTKPVIHDSITELIPIPEFSSHMKRWIKERPSFVRGEMIGMPPSSKIWDVQFYTVFETESFWEDKNSLAYILTLQDVTTEKKIQQRQILKKNIDSMQHLAASLAHEIKNPLTAIQLYLNIAQRYGKELNSSHGEKILHALSIIGQEVERLGAITSDFLTNIRPLSLKIVQIHPAELIDSLKELISPILAQGNIHFNVVIEEKLPSIAGDITYIRMVLLNILKNSIESFEGQNSSYKKRKIVMKLEENSPFIQIIVEDNGMGIDKKMLRQVFEPYFTTKKTGSGIGLSLSHKIILEHKGDIYIESQKGKGTRVTILLPVYQGVVHKFLSR